jgi:hypothetical protein
MVAPGADPRVTLANEALFREIDGEGAVFDLPTSTHFEPDDVGVRPWQLLQAYPSLQAACDFLLSEYEVEPDQPQPRLA